VWHATWFAVRALCRRRLNDVPKSVDEEWARRQKQLELVQQNKARAPGLANSRRPAAVTSYHVDERNALTARVAALEAENEKLREALEPFAEEAKKYNPIEDDNEDTAWDSLPTVGDLRGAATAAAGEEKCLEASPDDLRALGLMVAVHNDYRLNGETHTFWLMTRKDGMSFKGEGKTDAEALNQIRTLSRSITSAQNKTRRIVVVVVDAWPGRITQPENVLIQRSQLRQRPTPSGLEVHDPRLDRGGARDPGQGPVPDHALCLVAGVGAGNRLAQVIVHEIHDSLVHALAHVYLSPE
jgi:hypothetical protein